MIQILPLRDREELARINQEADGTAGFAYCLYGASDKPDGWILYDIDFAAGEALLRAAKAPGEGELDGLCRAVFSSVLDAGVTAARFAPALADAAARLGYLKRGESAARDLQAILRGCGHCGRLEK